MRDTRIQRLQDVGITEFAYNAFRVRMVERDEDKCMVCGDIDELQLHHRKTVKEHPELAMKEDNVVTLCGHCHRWAHGSDWNPDRSRRVRPDDTEFLLHDTSPEEREKLLSDARKWLTGAKSPDPFASIYLSIETSSSRYRPLLLVDILHYFFENRYEASRPLLINEEIEAAQELLDALLKPRSWEILYATYEVGVTWKGRIRQLLDESKGRLYAQIDALKSVGLLEEINEHHQEAEIALRKAKWADARFSRKNVKELYTIPQSMITPLTKIWQQPFVDVRENVKKNVTRMVDELARVRKQADELRKHLTAHCEACGDDKHEQAMHDKDYCIACVKQGRHFRHAGRKS